MALTNFASLTSNQLAIWSRDFWQVARNMSFINQFAGAGQNAMVQRITELTRSEKRHQGCHYAVGGHDWRRCYG